jgi:hypothetical protein
MTNLIKLSCDFARVVKSEGEGEDDGYVVKGIASEFGIIDSHGDIIRSAASFAELPEYLPAFYEHASYEIPIGKFSALRFDKKHLTVSLEFTKGLTKAEDARLAVMHGTVQGLSIGAYAEYERDAKGEIVRTKKGGGYLTNIALFEISLTTRPANKGAQLLRKNEAVRTQSDVDAINYLTKLLQGN